MVPRGVVRDSNAEHSHGLDGFRCARQKLPTLDMLSVVLRRNGSPPSWFESNALELSFAERRPSAINKFWGFFRNAPLAQLVEQEFCKLQVLCSSQRGGSRKAQERMRGIAGWTQRSRRVLGCHD